MNKISKKGDYIILRSPNHYEDVKDITNINENISIDCVNVLKYFRWSSGGFSYSDWFELSVNNLNLHIERGLDVKFWVDFKYELSNDCDFEIETTYLDATYYTKNKNPYPYPIAYSWETGNRFYPVNFRPGSFQPYQQAAAIKLNKDLSFIVNQIFGIDATYYKADPLYESRDSFLMEWGLINHRNPQCIKIVIPENNFPDNKFNFNMFGLDYEPGFEVHIDKRYFEWNFGYGSAPQKDDAIYIRINDRMYLVESSELFRDFMAEPVYFKLTLAKYAKKTYILQSDSIKNTIEELTTGFEKMFDSEMKDEANKVTNPMQLSDKTRYQDVIRDYGFDPNKTIQIFNLENYDNVVSQYHYNLFKVFETDGYKTSVLYKMRNTEEFQNQTFTCWYRNIQLKEYLNPLKNVTLTDNILTYQTDGQSYSYIEGMTITITSPQISNPNFIIYGKVINYNSTTKYVTIEIHSDIVANANTIDTNWSSRSLISKISVIKNLIDTYNPINKIGYKIDLIKEGFILLTLNDKIFTFKVENNQEWYGLIVNISKKYNQISLYQYKRQENDNKLYKIINYIYNYNILNYFSNEYYKITSGPILLTNIRLLVEPIPEEKHSLFLNQYMLTDSNNAIIVDNANPRLDLPFVGSVK